MLSESKLLSVIIPAYQAEQTIHRAVDSSLALSIDELEVIVVDDGSTDQTSHIVKELAEQDDRIVYIHQSNRGRSSARNAGIAASVGRWVMFVDADDYLFSEASDAICSALDSPASMVVFPIMINNENPPIDHSLPKSRHGRYTLYETSVIRRNTIDPENGFPAKHSECIYEPNAVWSRLYRRAALADDANNLLVSFPENLYMSEDRLFNIAFLSQVPADNHIAFYSGNPIYCWDQTNSKTVTNSRPKDAYTILEFVKVIEKMTSKGEISCLEQYKLAGREFQMRFSFASKMSKGQSLKTVPAWTAAMENETLRKSLNYMPRFSLLSSLWLRIIKLLLLTGHVIWAIELARNAQSLKMRLRR